MDVRIITATNRELQREVAEGRFREDLYYRLNVIPISLPPLRERKEDIPLLIDHFLKAANSENRKSVRGFTTEAMEKLMTHSWPGNIRELENLVERLVVLRGNGEIRGAELLLGGAAALGPEVLFEKMTIPDQGVSIRDLTRQFEETLIRKAMEKCGGNKNRAASLLQLNRTTLIEKIKKADREDG